MRIFLTLVSALALANCRGGETVANYGGAGVEWQLVLLDNIPFTPRATLQFGAENKIIGEAPCNSFSGVQTAPYPWFSVQNLSTTRRACSTLDQEATYLIALSEVTLSEVVGDTLILSNDAGREMLFRASKQ